MLDIKIKHVVTFSSEDKVYVASNLAEPNGYKKWKCSKPGEEKAIIVMEFEEPSQINSIDIGNEGAAFIEVLVGRSSDIKPDYKVLLAATPFMNPIESRDEECLNRVCMVGPEKLSENTRSEKWDLVKIVCTQPYNKMIKYGLSFIRFHPPYKKTVKLPQNAETENSTSCKLKTDKDGTLKNKVEIYESKVIGSLGYKTSSPNSTPVFSSSSKPNFSPQSVSQKRKIFEKRNVCQEPPAKKYPAAAYNKEHIVPKHVLENKLPYKKENGRMGNPASPKVAHHKNVLQTKPLEKGGSPITHAVSNPLTPAPKRLSKLSSVDSPGNSKLNVPFEKIMDRVVFVLSGFMNPLRSELRDKALQMGAKYKPDWDNTSTHLICAFLNTPKYQQVKKLNGKIVSKEWILDCYKKKRYIPGKKYRLDRRSMSSSSESEDDVTKDENHRDRKKSPTTSERARKQRLDSQKNNLANTSSSRDNFSTPKSSRLNTPSSKSNTPQKKDSPSIFSKLAQLSHAGISNSSQSPNLHAARYENEAEDEDILQDYAANIDTDDDSGGDTEDEILKVEMKLLKNSAKTPDLSAVKKDSEFSKQPDVIDLHLPELPNLFKQKHFHCFGKFSSGKLNDMHRYITAYNGVIEDHMSDKTKYVITDEMWNKCFEDALNRNEDLTFIKSSWIYKCHEAKKLVPYQSFIIVPDS